MDITIDIESMYYGLTTITELESKLKTFASALAGLSLPGELSTASLLPSCVSKANQIANDDVVELRMKLENSINILKNNDTQAAMLFKMYESGQVPQPMVYNDVPLYDQTQYSNPYSQGTVATSGCGLTCVCMVASYLMGQQITPDMMAAEANTHSNNVSRMLSVAEKYNIPYIYDKTTDTNDLKNYLSQGKLVVCLVKGSSHFVLCKGITEDGRILVNDPYGPWQLDHPYTLDELQMSSGQTWIFDASDRVVYGSTDLGTITVNADLMQQINDSNAQISVTALPATITGNATINDSNIISATSLETVTGAEVSTKLTDNAIDTFVENNTGSYTTNVNTDLDEIINNTSTLDNTGTYGTNTTYTTDNSDNNYTSNNSYSGTNMSSYSSSNNSSSSSYSGGSNNSYSFSGSSNNTSSISSNGITHIDTSSSVVNNTNNTNYSTNTSVNTNTNNYISSNSTYVDNVNKEYVSIPNTGINKEYNYSNIIISSGLGVALLAATKYLANQKNNKDKEEE